MDWSLSLTHGREQAIAVVVGIGQGPVSSLKA
jgi:hypothetical protein